LLAGVYFGLCIGVGNIKSVGVIFRVILSFLRVLCVVVVDIALINGMVPVLRLAKVVKTQFAVVEADVSVAILSAGDAEVRCNFVVYIFDQAVAFDLNDLLVNFILGINFVFRIAVV